MAAAASDAAACAFDAAAAAAEAAAAAAASTAVIRFSYVASTDPPATGNRTIPQNTSSTHTSPPQPNTASLALTCSRHFRCVTTAHPHVRRPHLPQRAPRPCVHGLPSTEHAVAV